MLDIFDQFIIFVFVTIMVAHTGIAWSLLLSPGSILDWLSPKIHRIRNPYIKDLLTCMKCVSGQVSLWLYVGGCFYLRLSDWPVLIVGGVLWVSWIIVVTDQLAKKEGYA